jgi:cell wall-associated NlpC family hydrolase
MKKQPIKRRAWFRNSAVLVALCVAVVTGSLGTYTYLANGSASIPPPPVVQNPWGKVSPSTAVTRASHPYRYTNESLDGLCGRYVAIVYGYSYLGLDSAKVFLQYIKDKHAFHSSRHGIAYGALVFFNTPGTGHVAIYAGDDKVWTVDYDGPGKVSKESIKRVADWAGSYQGWARAKDIPDFN